jgi:hypothetical protein
MFKKFFQKRAFDQGYAWAAVALVSGKESTKSILGFIQEAKDFEKFTAFDEGALRAVNDFCSPFTQSKTFTQQDWKPEGSSVFEEGLEDSNTRGLLLITVALGIVTVHIWYCVWVIFDKGL